MTEEGGSWRPRGAVAEEAGTAHEAHEAHEHRGMADEAGSAHVPAGSVSARRGAADEGASVRTRRAVDEEDENFLARFGLNHRQERLLKIVTVAVGIVVGAVSLTIAVASLGGGVGTDQTSAAVGFEMPRPDSYQGWTSPKLFAPVGERTSDAKALTVKEVFATKTLKSGHVTLKLVSSRLDDCASVAWGAALTEELAEAECTQAVRGLYTSADKRYVAQYTLFNLRDTQAADGLVEAMETQHRGGWTQALPSKKAAFPADGYTEASGHAMGHYAGLVWLAKADGADPAAGDDFVTLSLAVRGAEKAVYRRIVDITGPSAKPSQ
ncbi:hypothetical protein [Streptosporangium sp. KLBMP 9127]|nr:hypothetical protein [Streptosporangium sp. KLBMP 9127]